MSPPTPPVPIPGDRTERIVFETKGRMSSTAFLPFSPLTPSRTRSVSHLQRTHPTCTITPPKPDLTSESKSTPINLPSPPKQTDNLFRFLLDFITRPSAVELRERYGPIFETSLLGYPITVISDLQTLCDIYKTPEMYSSARAYPPFFQDVFGKDGMFEMDGSRHTNTRSKVQPAFAAGFFPSYFDKILQAVDVFYESVEQRVSREGKVKLEKMVKEHYLRIILHITTGSEPGGEEYDVMRDQFVALAYGTVSLPFSIARSKAKQARKELMVLLKSIIKQRFVERKEEIEELRNMEHSPSRMLQQIDLITVLCASSSLRGDEDMEDKELIKIADLIMLLWIAGFSTQSTATLCCMLEMMKSSSVWNKLQAEQDDLVQQAGTRTISYEQVMKQMPLLDSFINEVLRLQPPAAAVFRRPVEDVALLGHLVKKDEALALDFDGAQRDEKYFERPNELVVDRFVDKSVPSIVSFGVVGGAHFCVGSALAKICIRTTLAGMLREYDVELGKQDLGYQTLPERKPSGGVVVGKFCRRRSV